MLRRACGVDHEAARHVGERGHARERLVHLVGRDELDLGADPVLGAEVQHLRPLGLAEAEAGCLTAEAPDSSSPVLRRLGGLGGFGGRPAESVDGRAPGATVSR